MERGYVADQPQCCDWCFAHSRAPENSKSGHYCGLYRVDRRKPGSKGHCSSHNPCGCDPRYGCIFLKWVTALDICLFRFAHKAGAGWLLNNFTRGRDAEIPLLVACHFPFGFLNSPLDVVRVGRHFFGHFQILDGLRPIPRVFLQIGKIV